MRTRYFTAGERRDGDNRDEPLAVRGGRKPRMQDTVDDRIVRERRAHVGDVAQARSNYSGSIGNPHVDCQIFLLDPSLVRIVEKD